MNKLRTTHYELRTRRGFTLIEILIVVAIIGILSSVALVGLRGGRGRANDARRISDLRQTQHAIELYYQKCSYYPGDAQANDDCDARGGSETPSWDDLTAAISDSGIGINQIPNDPAGRDYFYGTDGSGYVLGAILEDETNPNLRGDVDGTLYGRDCDDPAYCIEF